MSEGFLRHLFFVLILLLFFFEKFCRSFYPVATIPFLKLIFQYPDKSYHRKKGKFNFNDSLPDKNLDKKTKTCLFYQKKVVVLFILCYSINDKNYSVITLIIIVNVSNENNFSTIERPERIISQIFRIQII